MLIERTAYTAAGVAVEYARDLFRPDRLRITLQTGIGTVRRAANLAVVEDSDQSAASRVSPRAGR